MADLYRFTCPSCGYEARVAGEPTASFTVYFETITCRDCKELRDVPFAVRLSSQESEGGGDQGAGPDDPVLEGLWKQYYQEFEDARDAHRPVNVRLIEDIHAAILTQQAMAKQAAYRALDPKCPRSEEHAWEPWRHPGPCPRCGETMEKGDWVPPGV